MLQKEIQKSLVLQQDGSDCGVACLKMLLRYYGSDSSLERLRELSGTNKQGTTLLGLYQAANALGFEAEGCEANIEALIEHAQPVILHVLMEGNLRHYVVCFPSQNGDFLVADPACGIKTYSAAALQKIWFSGKCLTVKPIPQLQSVALQQNQKKKWLLQLLRDDWSLLAAAAALGVGMAVLGHGDGRILAKIDR